MDDKILARLEARAKIMKAMAHPTRLFVVQALAEGEKCVCELRDMIGADISTVSKHLSLLKNAGIIKDRRNGSQILYSLKCPCVLNFFTCIENVLKTNAEEQLKLSK